MLPAMCGLLQQPVDLTVFDDFMAEWGDDWSADDGGADQGEGYDGTHDAGAGRENREPLPILRPGARVWALRREPKSGRRWLNRLQWGLEPNWWPEGRALAASHNARAETLADRPMFRAAWSGRRRCVVPVSRFFEWRPAAPDQGRGRRELCAIAPAAGLVLLMAGLWEARRTGDGSIRRTVTIVTVPANPRLAGLHPRMPALLASGDVPAWLNEQPTAPEQGAALLSPWPADDLTILPVPRDLTSPMTQLLL